MGSALAFLAAFAIFAGLAFGQNPNSSTFPSSAATDNTLFVAANNALTTLSGPITASTTAIPVVTTAGFIFPTLVSIGSSASEIVAVCSQTGGNQLNVCGSGRGFNGTSAQSFNTGAVVSANIVSWFHNQVAAEIKTVESWLIANPFGTVNSVAVTMPSSLFTLSGCTITTSGTCAVSLASQTQNQAFLSPNGSSGVPGWRQIVTADVASSSLFGNSALLPTYYNVPSAYSSQNFCVSGATLGLQNAGIVCGPQSTPTAPYNYSVTNGAGVTGNLATPGTNTLTFAPCPAGLYPAAFANKQRVEILGGSGTAEVALVTGGTCNNDGLGGTVIVTTANTHTGSWVATSANSGIQECLFAITVEGTGCEVGYGPSAVNSPIWLTYNRFLHGQSDTQDGSGTGVQLQLSSELVIGGLYPTSAALFSFVGASSVARLTVKYPQPDSPTYSAYTQFGPTFENTTADKFRVEDVTVENAWTLVQSCNATSFQGFSLVNVQASFFKYGVDACNQLDSIELNHVRFWNYGQTGNQINVMTANAIGMHLGATPDTKLTDVFMFLNMGIVGYPDPYTGYLGGRPVVNGVNVHIEPVSWFSGNFQSLNFSDFYFYGDNTTAPGGTLTEGNLTLDNGVANVTNPGAAMFSLPGTTNVYGYSATISNTLFNSAATDQTTITAAAPTFNWALDLNHNHFSRTLNVAYTNPVVNVGANVYGSVTANHCDPLGSGSGTLVAATSGANLFQHGNNCPGWGTDFTSSWTTLTPLNSWVAFGGGYYSPQYRISADGEVRARGPIYNGTNTYGTVIYTFPSGYRPSAAARFVCANSDTNVLGVSTLLDVLANGNVVLGSAASASSTPLWLDCIHFPAGN